MNRRLCRTTLEPTRTLGVIATMLLLFATTGCVTRGGRYAQSRFTDLTDALPMSLASGYGVSAHVGVTPFMGVGVGYADVYRFGFDDERFGPYWREKIYAIPLVSDIRFQTYPQDGDRWPGGDLETKIIHDQYRANTFVFLPGLASDGSVWPPLGEDSEWLWPRWSYWHLLDVEVGFVALFGGVRVGVSPGEFVDFLAGIFTFDPAGDDIPYMPPPSKEDE